MTSRMEGLASLALAMAQLERAQEQSTSPVSFVAPSSARTEHPRPGHSWDTAITAFPTQPAYDPSSARVVSTGSPSTYPSSVSPVTTTAAPAVPDKKSAAIAAAIMNEPQKQEPISSDDEDTPTPPSSDEIITIVKEDDVLCGRGGETNNHVGNIKYRDLVKQHQRQYLKAKRREKPRIAKLIVDTIRRRNGRFLKKHASDNTWRDVGNTKAREKTSQALREGAPELRDGDRKYSPKNRTKKLPKFVPTHHQGFLKRKESPTHLLVGTISPNANLVSPTRSTAVFQEQSFVLYPTAVSADSEDALSVVPLSKKVKRGPRLAILKARLQDE